MSFIKYIIPETINFINYSSDPNVEVYTVVKKHIPKLKVYEEYRVKYGERNGECKTFYEDGTLYELCYYKNDFKNGECKVWRKDGSLRAIYNYKDGLLDGEHKKWYPNGNLHSQELYKDGLLVECKYWNSKGDEIEARRPSQNLEIPALD